jgi:hypothetical protein
MMRRELQRAVLLAIAIALPVSARAQAAPSKPGAPKPIAAMAWLIGGVWTADAHTTAPGMQRIETRYQWSDNDAYIRFTTHFVSDQGTLKNYDGSFFWSPEQASLAMWYMDAGNSITQGPVTIRGDTMLMTFRAHDFEGKLADLRTTVTRHTNDDYAWLLEESQSGAWKPLLAFEYLRKAGS